MHACRLAESVGEAADVEQLLFVCMCGCFIMKCALCVLIQLAPVSVFIPAGGKRCGTASCSVCKLPGCWQKASGKECRAVTGQRLGLFLVTVLLLRATGRGRDFLLLASTQRLQPNVLAETRVFESSRHARTGSRSDCCRLI